MSALPESCPALVAYVAAKKSRTDNAVRLMMAAVVPLLVLGAIVVAVVAVVTDRASPLQLSLGSLGAALVVVTIAKVRRWVRSLAAKRAVRRQAGDHRDGRRGQQRQDAEGRGGKKADSRRKDAGGAVEKRGGDARRRDRGSPTAMKHGR